VVVPAWLRNQPQLVLQIGLDMPTPISDLRVDDAGVTGSLSFNRNLCLCVIPWESVFAIVGEDGRGMVWPESMPSEIAAEVEREAGRTRLRDASQPEPARPVVSDKLRQRETEPAPVVGSPRPDIRLAPQSSASKRPVQPASAIRKPRKVETAALETTTAPGHPAAAKHSRRGTDSRTKRPLPPYLRVVK
jgi:hypothetical protein